MKKFILIALSLAMAFGSMACQATPEESIVKGKDLDKMIEEATKPQEGASTSGVIAEKVGAQARYATDLTDAKGRVTIHVDADVVIPDVDGVSVQRVERGKFTQEQVDVLIDQLVKGDLFSGDGYKLTKAEIQEQILAIQAEIARSGDDGGTDDTNPKSAGAKREYMLADLQAQLETAPDVSEKIPCDGQLTPMTMETDFAEGEKLYALAQSEAGGYERLEVYNYSDSVNLLEYSSEKNGFSRDMGYFYTEEQIAAAESMGYAPGITFQEIADIPDITVTKEQAQQQAETLIAALGIGGLTCYSADKAYGGSYDMTADQTAYVNPRKCVWFLRYSRSVNGVPVTYTPWDCMKVEEDTQSMPWGYEDMTFAIDDSGIVGFSWRSPYNVTDTVTENCNLASFDDIMHVFDTMSLAVNAWESYLEYSPDLTGLEIEVSEIRFGLTRVTEQDKRDSGLLVPCWDFMGVLTQVMEVDGQTKRYSDGPIPILTVNAIDGSVINRSLGY